MSQDLPPVPHNVPITDQRTMGTVSPQWSDWFKKAFARMGGHLAPTNNDPIVSSRFAAGAVDTAALASGAVDLTKLVASVAQALIPSGAFLPYGGTSAPSGFLMCDGSAVNRTTYAALYTAIGNAFGSGDGSTTFNVPDWRGRFIRGVDGTAGNDPDKLSRTAMASGGNTGNAVGSVQADQYASHSHSVSNSGTAVFTTGTGNTATLSGSSSTGAAGGNETRPKNGYANYIIKY